MTPAAHPTPLATPRPAPGGQADPEARGTTGTGHAPCHHGELLQGVFLDADGRRCAGLVTLPMAGPGSRAEFLRRPGTPAEALTVVPATARRPRTPRPWRASSAPGARDCRPAEAS